MQYLAIQFLSLLIGAIVIGALLGYLWRRLVSERSDGTSSKELEKLQEKHLLTKGKVNKAEELAKTHEANAVKLTEDLTARDEIINTLRGQIEKNETELLALRQSGATMPRTSGDLDLNTSTGASATHLVGDAGLDSAQEGSVEEAKTEEVVDDARVNIEEYMAVVTELDKSRKEIIRLQKATENYELNGDPAAEQEIKKELTLAYSTIADLRAALASTGKTVPLRKHNELRDEYTQLRETLRRLQSQVSVQNDTVSKAEYDAAVELTETTKNELSECRMKLDTSRGAVVKGQEELIACQEEIFKLQAQLLEMQANVPPQLISKPAPKSKTTPTPEDEAPKKATVSKKKKSDAPDDLTKIRGIGRVISQQLNMLGITTFKQIAEFKAEDIQSVGEALGTFPDRINRDGWVESAKTLHKEKHG